MLSLGYRRGPYGWDRTSQKTPEQSELGGQCHQTQWSSGMIAPKLVKCARYSLSPCVQFLHILRIGIHLALQQRQYHTRSLPCADLIRIRNSRPKYRFQQFQIGSRLTFWLWPGLSQMRLQGPEDSEQ